MGRTKNVPSQRTQGTMRTDTQVSEMDCSDDFSSQSQSVNILEKHEDTINQAVSYLLKSHSNLHPVKRADVFSLWGNKQLSRKESAGIIKSIQKKLKSVYGIKMKKVEGQKFLLVNPINNFLTGEEISSSENFLILVLTTMAINKYKITADSLERNLQNLGVNMNSAHPVYGDISQHLKEFEKQMYIKKVNNNNEIIYEWGLRARLEVDKVQIIHLVGDVLGLDGDQLLNDPNFCEMMELKDDNPNSSSSSDAEDSE